MIYSPKNNRVLKIDLMLNLPPGQYLPITVQKGNALVDEAPVLWNTEAKATDTGFVMMIQQEGWYTISQVGSICLDNGSPVVQFAGWGDSDLWGSESIRAYAEFTLGYNNENMLFGIKSQ